MDNVHLNLISLVFLFRLETKGRNTVVIDVFESANKPYYLQRRIPESMAYFSIVVLLLFPH